MKKLAFFVIFSILATWTVLGQNADKKNHISSDFSILGGGIRYDRYVSEKFSTGVMAFGQLSPLIWKHGNNNSLDTYGMGIMACWYPLASGFYVELGLGYGTFGRTNDEYDTVLGLMITPVVGNKVFISKSFFINLMFSSPVILGTKEDTKEFGWGINIRPAIGIGFIF